MRTNLPKQGFVSEKILPHHLDRLAVVYVRQSTLQQVLDHQESTRLQYGLVHRAEALGWSSERILTIDEDLGKSGSSAEGRSGFQRLVTEVSLNHVGLIIGIEMSRLARSSKDWHHLLEVCALFGTLIADVDGIYDPSQYNDRLLLGLKGTMSEAELHLLKQRMLQGKLNKAQRGELGFHMPIGYIRRPSGEICFDPDEQAQQVVKLIFRKFEELGTLNAVLRYLVDHQIQIGVRVLSGVSKGDLEWHRPNRPTLQNLLKNPAYAGAYAYGQSHTDVGKQQAGRKVGRAYQGCVVTPMDEWQVLIQDHHPAYISWQQYQQNLAQLKSNQTRADELGSPRQGVGLLSGLVVCGCCGYRMLVQYHRQQQHRYVCMRELSDYGGKVCQQISGACLDELVVEQVLTALEPAALELSLAAASHLEQERTELDQLWQQRLERATFEAERAARHYQLVEPENRLVARQLAREWEAKLMAQHQLREDYERFTHQQSKVLSESERQAIRNLAEDIPKLWNANTTTPVQRTEIIRQVVQSITIYLEGKSEQVKVKIEWVGGAISCLDLIRPVATWTQLSNYSQLCQRLEQFVQAGTPTEEIVQCLNQEGFHPPKRRKTFNVEEVRTLIRRLGLGQSYAPKVQAVLAECEWWLPDLAACLQMPTVTLYNWVQRGWVKARQQTEYPKHWIIWADEAEVQRLRTHRQQPQGEILRQRWRGEILDITRCPDP
jgi:DNA invertase Pin-like site-specific DNA recombinase